MDIESVKTRLIAFVSGLANDCIAVIDSLQAENARLQLIINEANAQEPVGEVYKCSETGTGIDVAVYSAIPEGTTKLYARPIPAQQSVDRDTIINVLLSVGNMSEGIIADAIISAIGAQQSPASDSEALPFVPWSKEKDFFDSMQQSPAVAVPECVIADIKELIDFANKNAVSGNTTLPRHKVNEYLELLLDLAVQSPRITEQDALPEGYREEWKRNVMLMWSCVRKHDSSIPSDVLDYMREQLLDKLNKPESVGG